MVRGNNLREARRLYELGRPADEVVEWMLADDPTGKDDSDDNAWWARPVLERAASSAARSGDFERSIVLLERALTDHAQPTKDRVRLLISLGRVAGAAGRADSAARWNAAEDLLGELAPTDRVDALADLAEAMYESGLVADARRHFESAFAAGRADEHIGDQTMARISAGLSTTSLLTGRRHPDVARMLDDLIDDPPRHPALPVRALMASAAGEVALGIDLPAPTVHRLVDSALGEDPLPGAIMRPAVEALSAALSLTGRPKSALVLLNSRLNMAKADNEVVANVSVLALRAHAHFLNDELAAARADADEALQLIENHPAASRLAEAPARYALAISLLELDEHERAAAIVEIDDDRTLWAGTPMHGWFLDGRARVRAATNRHHEARRDWIEASRAFTLVGGTGTVCEWRDGLARSAWALGDVAEAEAVAAEQLEAALEFGEHRLVAIARATSAAVDSDHDRASHGLSAAIEQLPTGRSGLTRAQLGHEHGARLRRAGRRRAARDALNAALAIAVRLDAARLVRLIEGELDDAGGSSSRRAAAGHLALTPVERHTALLAIDGLTNAEIARRRGVSRKTVEAQLSSLYRKLGVRERGELAARLSED